jgi:hypothetical protein
MIAGGSAAAQQTSPRLAQVLTLAAEFHSKKPANVMIISIHL